MDSNDAWILLRKGVGTWNNWRKGNPDAVPDLGTDVSFDHLLEGEGWKDFLVAEQRSAFSSGLVGKGWQVDLSRLDLSATNLIGAKLQSVRLAGANLSRATLTRANLRYADLSGADLTGASLYEADLYGTNLAGATLRDVSLLRARFVGTNIEGATLDNCWVHGASVWEVKSNSETRQRALWINNPNTPDAPRISVENLEIAQFVSLIVHNEKIREAIDTIGAKGVLILGRFTEHHKIVLDALRDKLLSLDFVPIVFEFERPEHRDFTETVVTLASLSRFIIADITEPKSVPAELQALVPQFMIPFAPIMETGSEPFALFTDMRNKYRSWMLDLLQYKSVTELTAALEEAVVVPALRRSEELLARKAEALRIRHAGDYVAGLPL